MFPSYRNQPIDLLLYDLTGFYIIVVKGLRKTKFNDIDNNHYFTWHSWRKLGSYSHEFSKNCIGNAKWFTWQMFTKKGRNSHRECFLKRGVLKTFAQFTGKHLYQSPFFSKVADLTLFLQSTSRRLTLKCFTSVNKSLKLFAVEDVAQNQKYHYTNTKDRNMDGLKNWCFIVTL